MRKKFFLLSFLAILFWLPSMAYAAYVLPIENGSIAQILVDGNTVHVLTQDHSTEKRTCYELTEVHQLIPCDKECVSSYLFDGALTPGGKTYSLGYPSYLWQPNAEEGPWVSIGDMSGDLEAYGNQLFEDNILFFYTASDQGTLYTVTNDCQTPNDFRVAAFDLATGTGGEILQRNTSIYQTKTAVMPDGRLAYNLGDSPCSFYAVDATGKNTLLFQTELTKQYEAIASDGENGFLVLVESGLYHVDGEGNAVKLNEVPAHQFDSLQTSMFTYLPERKEVIFSGSNALGNALYIVPLEMEKYEELVVAGSDMLMVGGLYNAKQTFGTKHPSVRVVQQESITEFTDISQQLTTGNSGCDLFILRTGDDSIRSVIKKGYFEDLSDMPEVTAFVSTLYPVWRDEVTAADGRIGALPVNVGGNFRLGYNTALWEELQLGDVPQTYDELLDCIERWLQDGTLEYTPLFRKNYRSYYSLVHELLRANAAWYASRGEVPVYENETLLALLQRLEGMKDALDALDKRRVVGDGLLRANWLSGLETPAANEGGHCGLYLGFADAQDRGELQEFYAIIINPHSEKKELARAFLRDVLGEMTDTTRCMLVDALLPGVEVEGYAESRQRLVEVGIPEAEARYAQALQDETITPSELKFYRDFLEDLQDSLIRSDNDRYLATPEVTERYYQQMQHPAVYRADGYALITRNATSDINRYINGKISLEALVKKLDEVVWMWTMENQ